MGVTLRIPVLTDEKELVLIPSERWLSWMSQMVCDVRGDSGLRSETCVGGCPKSRIPRTPRRGQGADLPIALATPYAAPGLVQHRISPVGFAAVRDGTSRHTTDEMLTV